VPGVDTAQYCLCMRCLEHLTIIRAVVWKTYALLVGKGTCCIYDFKLQTWQEREAFKTNVIHFGLTINHDTLYIAGGGTGITDKDKKTILTCTDEVKSVSVRDVIENKPTSWKHHAKLPRPARVFAFSPIPIVLTADGRV